MKTQPGAGFIHRDKGTSALKTNYRYDILAYRGRQRMRLFYYQPDIFGPASLFVLADSAHAACDYFNEYAEKQNDTDTYGSYGQKDIKEAVIGEVIENDNS